MKKRSTLPSPAKWRVHFFERRPADDPKRTVPGREFLESCPEKVRAMMLAVVKAVADAPPPMFSGGGKWEAMHDEMKGFYELRSTARTDTTTDSFAFSSRTTHASVSVAQASSSLAAKTNRFAPFCPLATTEKFGSSATSIALAFRGVSPADYAACLREGFAGTSCILYPSAAATLRMVESVGFGAFAVKRRRTISGLAEMRRASSALVTPRSIRASSSARTILSTASTCARAFAYFFANDGLRICAAKNLSKPVFGMCNLYVTTWIAASASFSA